MTEFIKSKKCGNFPFMKIQGIQIFLFLLISFTLLSCTGNGIDERNLTVKDAYQACFESAKEEFDGLTANDFKRINPNVCNSINIYKRNELATSCIRACNNAYNSFKMKSKFMK